MVIVIVIVISISKTNNIVNLYILYIYIVYYIIIYYYNVKIYIDEIFCSNKLGISHNFFQSQECSAVCGSIRSAGLYRSTLRLV